MCLRQATVTLSVLLALALPAFSQATVLPQSPVDPEPTVEEPSVPGPEAVPGKEYSTDTDTNAAGEPAPGQVVHWQGDGNTVWDSFKIIWPGGTGGPGVGGGPIGEQIDALANVRDLYFQDVVADRIPLLVSLKNSKDIYAARSSVMGGNSMLWAKWDTQINNKLGAIDDVDALEVWGPDDSDDADMYSWKGDPAFGGQRISIWRYHPGTDTSVPYLRTSVLLDHLITDDGNKVDWNYWDANLVDLSNLMVWDNGDDDSFNESYVLTRSGAVELRKDMILFGVKPIPGLFDGGEIWVYTFGDDKAQFLVQGLDGTSPRVWNTANNVAALFGLPTEEIDALEALPEPTSVCLLALGGLALLRRRNNPRR